MNTFNEQLFHVLFQNDKYLKLYRRKANLYTFIDLSASYTNISDQWINDRYEIETKCI